MSNFFTRFRPKKKAVHQGMQPLLCHPPFDLLPPIQCCCFRVPSHAKKKVRRALKKKQKKHGHAFSSSLSHTKNSQHQTRLPNSHFFRSCFSSVIEVVFPFKGWTLALFQSRNRSVTVFTHPKINNTKKKRGGGDKKQQPSLLRYSMCFCFVFLNSSPTTTGTKIPHDFPAQGNL